MSNFRINIYLTIKSFLLSFLISNKKKTKNIISFLKKKSRKKNIILTSQLRVGFIIILRYLKKINPKKREIIVSSYNLAEMVNICRNLNLSIIFPQLNKNLFFDDRDLKKKINNKTLAVVITNIFNNYQETKKIKDICKKNKIPLIEDNAIYFGNFKKIKNKKIYAGSFGDYILNSFNIMKNISAMYGGSIETNDYDLFKFATKELKSYKQFPLTKFLNQSIIFLILKTLTIKIFYKLFFLGIIKWANETKNKFFLSIIYPSLRFKKQKFPNYYFTQMSKFSENMIYLQINDKKNFNENHDSKKRNNIYYSKMFKKNNIKDVKLIEIMDVNFQNFNDYPIIVNRKNELVNFLFSKGVETKTIQYVDCQKIFQKNEGNKKLREYENKVLCLPNHKKISYKYIEYIVRNIHMFYKNN